MQKASHVIKWISIYIFFLGIGGICSGWYAYSTNDGYYPDDPWWKIQSQTRSAKLDPQQANEENIRTLINRNTVDITRLSQLVESHIDMCDPILAKLSDVVLTEREARITRLETDMANVAFWLRTFSIAIIGLGIYVIQEMMRRSFERKTKRVTTK